MEKCIRRARNDWGVTVYLEPGEACALNAGYLLTRVLDVVQNGDTTVAILDASAACHTPDVIEMPYRPPLLGTGEPGEKPCTVRLAGPTCLAGMSSVITALTLCLPWEDLLVFGDMAIYTTCKNNTFNGMPLPGIYARKPDGTTRKIVTFGYTDFKCRRKINCDKCKAPTGRPLLRRIISHFRIFCHKEAAPLRRGMSSFSLLSLQGFSFIMSRPAPALADRQGYAAVTFASAWMGTGGIFREQRFSASGVATLETTIKRITAVK